MSSPKKRNSNKNSFHPPAKVGILGGGQLARMLSLDAFPLGVQAFVLSEKESDPAAQSTGRWIQGSPHSSKDLKSFFKKVDVVTFESEFMDAELVEKISKKEKTLVFPTPKTIANIQDRLTQKKMLEKHGLPTSKFWKVDNFLQAEKAFKESGKALVFKKRRHGYDGYGTYVVKTHKSLEKIKDVLEKNTDGFIAEEFIPFQRETAVMAARNRSGDIQFFPFVETKQEDSRCLWVKGPLKTSQRYSALKSKIKKFLEKTQYVGCMGIEFFETQSQVLINELAPRVHNSGHYSQNACSISQFEMHIRCLLDLPLGKVTSASGFAMMNLLGEPSHPTKNSFWEKNFSGHLHWYGKSETRPGRKLGHLNIIDMTPESALRKAIKSRKAFLP